MAAPDTPPLRYFPAEAVAAAMPDLDERLALAERTMIALVDDAQLPPKIGVHPRPEGSFAHAMPAHLRDPGRDGSADLLGMKWVTGFATNNVHRLPAVNALVILNDPATGLPIAILDGGPITAARTAAVSGVVLRAFGPPRNAPKVALIGAGVQGRSHVPVIGHVLPGADLAVFDRHAERSQALADQARATAGIGGVHVAPDARSAVAGANVVITAASFGPVRQVMTREWLVPDALVVPVDYATYCAAEVASEAALFLVDQREQFLANRDAGLFEGYPDPTATIGEAIRSGMRRPDAGRVVASHLGVGLADLVFGDAIARRATALGLGMALPR